MFLRIAGITAVLAAGMLVGCGTSTSGPGGSKAQTMTGMSSESQYPPPAHPKDPESPALGSSSEQENSHPGPKVPVAEAKK